MDLPWERVPFNGWYTPTKKKNNTPPAHGTWHGKQGKNEAANLWNLGESEVGTQVAHSWHTGQGLFHDGGETIPSL